MPWPLPYAARFRIIALSSRRTCTNMDPRNFRCAVLSAVKHDYVARGVASHPRFELAVAADDPEVPGWVHERNRQFADAHRIPYVRDVEHALREFDTQVAIVSPEAERHCALSLRAVLAGKHVIQDKPLATWTSNSCRARSTSRT